MIKHNSPSSVLSQYNPISSLNQEVRQIVNNQFILPKLFKFFSKIGGIENYIELDPDLLITEVEFEQTENFIQSYVYKFVVDSIEKEEQEVKFKPKYVITFDHLLTDYSECDDVRYGVIRLGTQPILYYIYIDLQDLISFIKKIPQQLKFKVGEVKNYQSEIVKRTQLFDQLILSKVHSLSIANNLEKLEIEKQIARLEAIRNSPLEGVPGNLRVNLTWSTTDDLDLHIITPNGEIAYNTPNKSVEHMGVIGVLDVDKNSNDELVSNPQENINFIGQPVGLHYIYVQLYNLRENNDVNFQVSIIPANENGCLFSKTLSGKGTIVNVASFEYFDNKIKISEI